MYFRPCLISIIIHFGTKIFLKKFKGILKKIFFFNRTYYVILKRNSDKIRFDKPNI